MSNSQRYSIVELDRDRYARTATMKVGDLQLTTPNFFTHLKRDDELNLLMYLQKAGLTAQTNGSIVRLFDANSIIGSHLHNVSQTRLDSAGVTAEGAFLDFLNNFVLIIDPATEYLFYETNLSEWRNEPRLPQPILSYVNERLRVKENESQRTYENWKSRFHSSFWTQVYTDSAMRNTMIGDIFDRESQYRTSILLPPVPLIKTSIDFEIAKKVNEVSPAIAAQRDADCATYLTIASEVLNNEELIDEILDYVAENPLKITVFKFKNLDLARQGSVLQLRTFGHLLAELATLKEMERERVFMLLECGYQLFPSAAVAFDVVSTSMTGYDGDIAWGKGEDRPFGSLLDTELMVHIKFQQVKEIYHNNDGHLKCAHPTCSNFDIGTVTPEDWFGRRRLHYTQTMGDWMKEIRRAIVDKNIELASQKLTNSDLSRLKKLIPR